jgi:hypothetical protein
MEARESAGRWETMMDLCCDEGVSGCTSARRSTYLASEGRDGTDESRNFVCRESEYEQLR